MHHLCILGRQKSNIAKDGTLRHSIAQPHKHHKEQNDFKWGLSHRDSI